MHRGGVFRNFRVGQDNPNLLMIFMVQTLPSDALLSDLLSKLLGKLFCDLLSNFLVSFPVTY